MSGATAAPLYGDHAGDVEQFTILETMLPTHFLAFAASGACQRISV